MTTPPSQPEKRSGDAVQAHGMQAAAVSPPPSVPRTPAVPTPAMQEEAAQSQPFYFEDEPPDLGTPFVAPFQLSNAMPTVLPSAQPSDQNATVSPALAPSPTKTGHKRLSLPKLALILCVLVIVGVLSMNILAQATPSLQTQETRPAATAQQTRASSRQAKPTARPSPTPTAASANGQGPSPTTWVPQQLPPGWSNAGLQTGDAIQALRTAVTFTDREMSLDYRSVGTRNQHGGTFTAATFLMTPADRQRFQNNDVRAINNTLFDMVVT